MPELLAIDADGETWPVQVDALTHAWASRYKWRITTDGHVYRNSSTAPEPENGRPWRVCRRFYLHREIMGLLHGDERVVNHLNRDPADNRATNLEVCTQADNMRHWMGQGVAVAD